LPGWIPPRQVSKLRFFSWHPSWSDLSDRSSPSTAETAA